MLLLLPVDEADDADAAAELDVDDNGDVEPDVANDAAGLFAADVRLSDDAFGSH